MSSPELESFDVIVVGGSYAGMSAALQLARARRRVLVVDSGQPRNRFASTSHGLLAHDGDDPAAILNKARTQLLAYPTLRWVQCEVESAARRDEGRFHIRCSDGQEFEGQRLILAYGTVDDLPDIEGLEERWGTTAFHCPYCHGYEVFGGRIAVLGCTLDEATQQALMLTEWGEVTLVCQHASELDGALASELAERGVRIESVPVVKISEEATLHLADGRTLQQSAIFLSPTSRLSCSLAQELGCELEDLGCITTDSSKQTTVAGVFACGDAGRLAGNVSLAIGEGALAGIAAHRSLWDAPDA